MVILQIITQGGLARVSGVRTITERQGLYVEIYVIVHCDVHDSRSQVTLHSEEDLSAHGIMPIAPSGLVVGTVNCQMRIRLVNIIVLIHQCLKSRSF